MPTRSLNVLIATDTKGLEKGRQEAEKEFDKIEKAGTKLGANLRTSVGSAGAKVGGSLRAGLSGIPAIAALAGAAAGAALVKGVVGAMDVQEANTKLKVQLGLTTKESARIGRIAGRLYASNYGDSLGEVNGAIRNVVTDIDGLRNASSSRLRGITGDVISVSQAFDQDLGGVTRAVGQLMRTGLAKDSQDALNIVTKGFQKGADKSGDFLDTLNEYGTQFRKLGLSGEKATGIISQGLKAGARDGDLVADSLKEFSIRALDGSDTTKAGFASLGLDAQKMSEKIGKGGADASKGLDQTLDRLRKVKDPVKQSQIAVELFGTQAEDLGKALFALDPSKAVDGLGKVSGAARKVNTELGSTAKSQISEFWRTLQTGGTSALSKVTPMLGNAAGAATSFIKGFRNGTGAGGEFASKITSAIDRVKGAVSGWVSENREDIDSVLSAFRTVGKFAKNVFEDTLVPIVKRSIAALGPLFGGVYGVVRGVVRLVSGLVTGDWDKAWGAAKDIVKSAFKIIKTTITTQIANMLEIVKDIGPDILKLLGKGLLGIGKAVGTGILKGLGNLGHLILDKVKDAMDFVGDNLPGPLGAAAKIGTSIAGKIGDGAGRAAATALPSGAGLAGGSLMGASSIMSPFVSLAGRFGLNTSSGIRPGAITSSGNPSFHGSGNAVDEAGTPEGMLGYFRYLKAKFGSKLRELIYTPGGVGIKDGKPFRYTGQVAADHFDHVHVAYTGGTGDGIGRAARTGDGPGRIFNWGKSHGFSDEQAAGWVGNIAQESGFDSKIKQANGPGRGLAQWGGGRFTALMTFAGKRKKPWTDFDTQLDFMWSELQGTERGAYSAIKASKSVEAATSAIATQYERAGTIGDRLGPAKAALARFGKGRTGGKSKSSSSAKAPDMTAVTDAPDSPTYGGEGTSDPFGITAASSAPAFANAKKGIGVRPAKGGGPTKGFPVGYTPPERADAPVPPSTADYIQAAIAEAALTAGTDDDLAALIENRSYQGGQLELARRSGDPRAIAQAAADFKSASEAVEALTAATKENTRTLQESMDNLSAEIKRQTDFAGSVQATDAFQMKKAFADLLSGELGGRGVARRFTPGTGVEVAY